MANDIYNSTWWGNTIDTASSIGTSTDMIQGQFNMNDRQEVEAVKCLADTIHTIGLKTYKTKIMAKPKLALIPATQGSKLYSVLPADGVGDFSFNRSGSATRINKDGLIETVASGKSRLNYPLIDGVVNGCPSHLLEPTRQNLVVWSNNLSSNIWQSGQVSKSANQTISPDGTLNASKVAVTLTNNTHWFQQTFAIGENDVTISAYVKNIDANFIQVTNAGNVNAYANFDIQNGTVGTNGSAMPNPKIEKLPNDWYRISVAVDNTGFASTFMRFYIVNSASANFNQGFFPTSAVSLYFWGGQCELGSFETSVIPTTTSAVTRSAETAIGSGDTTTFGSEGVLMAEISTFSTQGIKAISITDAAFTQIITVRYSSGQVQGIYVNSSNSVTYQINHTLPNVKDNIKVALLYQQGALKLYVNGVLIQNIPLVLDTVSDWSTLRFDIGNSTQIFYGNVKQVQYFDEVLTDAELIALTTI